MVNISWSQSRLEYRSVILWVVSKTLPGSQFPQTTSGISRGGVTPGLHQFLKLVCLIATSPQILSVSSETIHWKGEGMWLVSSTWLPSLAFLFRPRE